MISSVHEVEYQFPVTVTNIQIDCPIVKKVMLQNTFIIEHSKFYNFQTANEYLFTQLNNRLRFPTTEFDVVTIKITLIDRSTIKTIIPLQFREHVLDFLQDLHYKRGINIVAYYSFLGLQEMVTQAMISRTSPFSLIVLNDIKQRLNYSIKDISDN